MKQNAYINKSGMEINKFTDNRMLANGLICLVRFASIDVNREKNHIMYKVMGIKINNGCGWWLIVGDFENSYIIKKKKLGRIDKNIETTEIIKL